MFQPFAHIASSFKPESSRSVTVGPTRYPPRVLTSLRVHAPINLSGWKGTLRVGLHVPQILPRGSKDTASPPTTIPTMFFGDSFEASVSAI